MKDEFNERSQFNTGYYVQEFNLIQSTTFACALNEYVFPRPTINDVFYQSKSIGSLTLYFRPSYFNKLKSEINKQFEDGLFSNPKAGNQWSDLRYTIDSAIQKNDYEISKLKSFYEDFIDKKDDTSREIIFETTKYFVSENLVSKEVEQNCRLIIILSKNLSEIFVFRFGDAKRGNIDNLKRISNKENEIILENKDYSIKIKHSKNDITNIIEVIIKNKNFHKTENFYNGENLNDSIKNKTDLKNKSKDEIDLFLDYCFKKGKEPNKSINNWNCDICGGNTETGCLYFDQSECPKFT